MSQLTEIYFKARKKNKADADQLVNLSRMTNIMCANITFIGVLTTLLFCFFSLLANSWYVIGIAFGLELIVLPVYLAKKDKEKLKQKLELIIKDKEAFSV